MNLIYEDFLGILLLGLEAHSHRALYWIEENAMIKAFNGMSEREQIKTFLEYPKIKPMLMEFHPSLMMERKEKV